MSELSPKLKESKEVSLTDLLANGFVKTEIGKHVYLVKKSQAMGYSHTPMADLLTSRGDTMGRAALNTYKVDRVVDKFVFDEAYLLDDNGELIKVEDERDIAMLEERKDIFEKLSGKLKESTS